MTTVPASLDGWVDELSATVPGAIVDAVDIAACPRPTAVRSRLHQTMARLSATLYAAPAARRAIVLVWTGDDAVTPRARAASLAAAEAVHRRSEMMRGCPLGLVVIFLDSHTPLAPLRRGVHTVPDGVAAVSWGAVCAHGIREAVAASRI